MLACHEASGGANSCWPSLQILKLSHNKVGMADGCGLPGLLRLCVGLRELYLESCGISHAMLVGRDGFAEALKSKTVPVFAIEPQYHFSKTNA